MRYRTKSVLGQLGWIVLDVVVETVKSGLAAAADEKARAWAKRGEDEEQDTGASEP